jgi:plasmid stabilization system protein ParE
MPETLRFLPEAEAEINEAAERFLEYSVSAALHFAHELRAARDRVAESPQIGPRHLRGSRRMLFTELPYMLVYHDDSDEIIVVAVAHQRRKPGYWLRRRRR